VTDAVHADVVFSVSGKSVQTAGVLELQFHENCGAQYDKVGL
jgi:hypothetical protein